MKDKKVNKDETLIVRVTKDEKEYIRKYAEERGTDMSAYVKEKIFSKAGTKMYNENVQRAIYLISDILYYRIGEHCDDKEFVSMCKKASCII